MNIPLDILRRIIRYLSDAPVTLLRCAQTCHLSRREVDAVFIDTFTQRVMVEVLYTHRRYPYELHYDDVKTRVRPTTGDANQLLDHAGNHSCRITWGNLQIEIRRYGRNLYVSVFVVQDRAPSLASERPLSRTMFNLRYCGFIGPDETHTLGGALALIKKAAPGICQ